MLICCRKYFLLSSKLKTVGAKYFCGNHFLRICNEQKWTAFEIVCNISDFTAMFKQINASLFNKKHEFPFNILSDPTPFESINMLAGQNLNY